jgi:hypothetical protein
MTNLLPPFEKISPMFLFCRCQIEVFILANQSQPHRRSVIVLPVLIYLYMQLAKIFTITRNPAAPYNIVQVRVFFPLNIDLGPAMHLTVEKGCQVDVSCLNIGHLH